MTDAEYLRGLAISELNAGYGGPAARLEGIAARIEDMEHSLSEEQRKRDEEREAQSLAGMEAVADLSRRLNEEQQKPYPALLREMAETIQQERIQNDGLRASIDRAAMLLGSETKARIAAVDEAARCIEYAEQCSAALAELCRLKHTKRLAEAMPPGSYRDKLLAEYEAGKDPAWGAAFVALAKNPNPAGLPVAAGNEDPVSTAAGPSGPVGLGPRCNCAVLPNCAHARSCPMYGSQGEPALNNPVNEPTENMVIAGFECEAFDTLDDTYRMAGDGPGRGPSCKQAAEAVRGIYQAMLAAAPAQSAINHPVPHPEMVGPFHVELHPAHAESASREEWLRHSPNDPPCDCAHVVGSDGIEACTTYRNDSRKAAQVIADALNAAFPSTDCDRT